MPAILGEILRSNVSEQSEPNSQETKPRLATTVAEIRSLVAEARRRGEQVGFVPTMGALHAGHVQLMKTAREECAFVVASIFVNPTQFAPHEDFHKYPRPLERDLAACRSADVAAVFHPVVETMYPPGASTFVEVPALAQTLEGTHRPTHFKGVATVVTQLFQIVQPDRAYFGQKDYQQQTLIRRMVRDLHIPIEIRVCPTVREPDGLAMSSRNVYLQGTDRQSALALSQALKLAREQLHQRNQDLPSIRQAMHALLSGTPGVVVDYATLIDPDSLAELAAVQPRMVAIIAARVGTTRLIDNEVIEVK